MLAYLQSLGRVENMTKAVISVTGLDATGIIAKVATKLSELKSKTEITPELLRNVADTCNIIKSNPRELDRDEIYGILCECL